jgi:hypothetical protein
VKNVWNVDFILQGRLLTKIGNRCFENESQFRYLGMTATNQNLIQEEIKEEIELW